MYGIDESGYYHIDVPRAYHPNVLKSIMKKGYIAHLGITAMDLSFEGFRTLNVRILKCEDVSDQDDGYHTYNFKVQIIDSEMDLFGILAVDDKYEDGEIILLVEWVNGAYDNLMKLKTLIKGGE